MPMRRIRGVLTLAALWALVWLAITVALGLILALFGAHTLSRAGLFYLGVFTALGAGSGAVFASLLALIEGNRVLNELSPRRFALWGAIGGVAIPVIGTLVLFAFVRGLELAPDAPSMFALMAGLGALCAMGTLKIARARAPISECRVDAPPT